MAVEVGHHTPRMIHSSDVAEKVERGSSQPESLHSVWSVALSAASVAVGFPRDRPSRPSPRLSHSPLTSTQTSRVCSVPTRGDPFPLVAFRPASSQSLRDPKPKGVQSAPGFLLLDCGSRGWVKPLPRYCIPPLIPHPQSSVSVMLQ